MNLTVMSAPPSHDEQKWDVPLDVVDLAAELRTSERSLRRWIAAHGIKPAGKVGRRYYYWKGDFVAADRDARKRQRASLFRPAADRVA